MNFIFYHLLALISIWIINIVKSEKSGLNDFNIELSLGNNIYDHHLAYLASIPHDELVKNQKISTISEILKNENSKKSKDKNEKSENQTEFNITLNNVTYSVNKTSNNTECIPECYLNCQVHFPDPTEQKYCLINVCKCDIVEENGNTTKTILIFNLAENTSNKDNSTTPTDNSISPNINYKFDEVKERQNFYFLLALLFILMIPPFIYYLVQMFKNLNNNELGYEYPQPVDEYKLLGDLNEGDL